MFAEEGSGVGRNAQGSCLRHLARPLRTCKRCGGRPANIKVKPSPHMRSWVLGNIGTLARLGESQDLRGLQLFLRVDAAEY